jgi:hypothetical protein
MGSSVIGRAAISESLSAPTPAAFSVQVTLLSEIQVIYCPDVVSRRRENMG